MPFSWICRQSQYFDVKWSRLKLFIFSLHEFGQLKVAPSGGDDVTLRRAWNRSPDIKHETLIGHCAETRNEGLLIHNDLSIFIWSKSNIDVHVWINSSFINRWPETSIYTSLIWMRYHLLILIYSRKYISLRQLPLYQNFQCEIHSQLFPPPRHHVSDGDNSQ